MAKPRTVLVTGASSGLGLATASLLASRGFVVFGTSRNPSKAGRRDFQMLTLDVDSDDSVRTCVKDVVDQAGNLDVLVNNAGYALTGAIEETSTMEAKSQFETNFFGVVRLVNRVLPIMRKRRSGQIINVGSIAGLAGSPLEGFYTAAKFALEGYTESLRLEVREFNIKVSILDAGFFKTNIGSNAKAPSRPLTAYDEQRKKVGSVRQTRRKIALLPAVFAEAVLRIVKSNSPRFRYTVGAETWYPRIASARPPSAGETDVRKFWNLSD